jgi:hypothetical protein
MAFKRADDGGGRKDLIFTCLDLFRQSATGGQPSSIEIDPYFKTGDEFYEWNTSYVNRYEDWDSYFEVGRGRFVDLLQRKLLFQ